jgi:FKBP-type peptidyl-prolyl cis-trans isomerase FklB
MKLRVLTIALLGLGLVSSVYAAGVELKNDTDKLSYTIGNDMGSKFKQQNIAVNPVAFEQGLNDALNGKEPALTLDQQKAVMENFQKTMMTKMQSEMKVQGEKNAKEGKAFLAKNAKEKGVKTTKSGLQYKVIEEGKGPKPSATDTVTVNYEGTLLDGTVFDSSYQRGKPVSFPLNGVIPGWTEALQLMPVGSTYMIYIPSNLAYGEQGAPGAIGPNQTLTFKIQLISTEKATAGDKSAAKSVITAVAQK